MPTKLTLEEMLLKTDKRQEAFRLMVDHIRHCENPLVVETGVSRQEDNFFGDGMSSLIWDAAVNEVNGTVQSVDSDPVACAFTAARTSNKTMIYCGDSVEFLSSKEKEYDKLNRKIDLLYLDSYDLDIHNSHPSSLHHIYELLAIKGALSSGSLVCVDDNLIIEGKHVGKGAYVAEVMHKMGKPMIYMGYQFIWQW